MSMGIILYGCDSTDTVTGTQNGNLSLSMSGLQDLGSSAIYEGWIIVSGTPMSTGTFSVDANGQLSQTSFSVDATQLSSASTFVISIEPVPDPNAAPSDVKYLGGDFSGNTANLTIGHSLTLGSDFTSATGKYVLATPTNGTNTNELSGVWFLDLSSGMPSQGLILPTLPTGWMYEGWAVVNGTAVTTGKFTDPNAADNSAPYSGPMPGPPFPGEDLLQNAPAGLTFPTNLQGTKVVLTIEPNPDNSTKPFTLKPLAGDVPPNAGDRITYDMNNQAGTTNPTGTVTR